jgi:hypothetical protein
MGIASECSMGISADPSASRIMSGRALAMTGDAVGSCVRREVRVVVARENSQVRFPAGLLIRPASVVDRRNTGILIDSCRRPLSNGWIICAEPLGCRDGEFSG